MVSIGSVGSRTDLGEECFLPIFESGSSATRIAHSCKSDCEHMWTTEAEQRVDS